MSDRFGSEPPDKPIIGANPSRTPPPPPPRPPVIGGYSEEPLPSADWEDEGPYDDDYDYGDEDEDYYDEYYDDAPARQPMFYVLLALAAIVGGIFIFLLYSIVTGNGGDEPKKLTDLKIVIDQPFQNERIETGKPLTVSMRANSTEPINRIELLINGNVVDQFLPPPPPPADLTYAHSFNWRFSAKGDYKVIVRVTSESGGTRSSDAVTVVAFEGVGDKPVAIKGKVLASVSMRTGPGESFEAVGRLNPGDDVNVLGKTRDSEWLLIESNNQQRWVPRTAIELLESLALVPVREATPVPATPTSTPSRSPSPSPSPSPTANPRAPDFAPTNAVLVDGGARLRVTIANLSSNAHAGSLVVSVSGVGPGTLTQAFGVNLPANGNATVDFDLNPPVTGQKTAQVKVDPDNAIKEANEDNNVASFGLTPPLDQPEIVITGASVQAGGINVTIQNNGGPLAATTVTVRVKIVATGSESSQPQNLALAKGQSATFSGIVKPGTGAAIVEVVVGGQVLASQAIVIPP